ncbi:MAG: DUF92 domain-containing protein [Terracidiphilus sp.]|jgi:uncharacterized protein (TIGR00297 family)
MNRLSRSKLAWESKLVLLAVLPFAGADVVLQTHWWATQAALVAVSTVGLSLLLALAVLKLRAATRGGAFAGATITASLMFSTETVPYRPWQTALIPVLAVSLLAWLATRLGREEKERLGTAERRRGRTASQVAANLGVAAIASNELVQSWLAGVPWLTRATTAPALLFAVGLAALAEAAADTVSSELGQVIGGRPRMITTLRLVEPGTDGAISLAGTLAGVAAAAAVALAGTLALRGGLAVFWIACAGGVFGFFFDSLLGATLERRGWLNNDAVNFLSTASAAAFALGLLAILVHP